MKTKHINMAYTEESPMRKLWCKFKHSFCKLDHSDKKVSFCEFLAKHE